MESGFGENLEGFLIKGNLSLAPAEIPALQGNGSIEAAGTLYIKNIQEYNNGITIQNIIISDDTVYVPYTQPSSQTTASFVLDGGLTIKHTQNSTSLSSGGGITIAGGASIQKNVNIGGITNVNNNKIINLSLPTIGSDAANKEYVDSVADRVSGNFTTGQVIIAESDGDAIRGYDSFTFNGSQLSIDTPVYITNTTDSSGLSTGALVNYGGASFNKNVYIGGTLSLENNNIVNLAYPINNTDAATKQYVDDHKLQGNFTTGQIIIAANIGSEIQGYENLTYDGYTITLSSTNNISGSSGGAFVCYGGISINKDAFINGTLNLNNHKIINVAEPTNNSDVATKYYVDNKTYGNILGSVGYQEISIGTTDPNSLTSYSNFKFDGSTLSLGTNGSVFLSNTSDALGLGSGGSITTLGGASISGKVYIGDELDMNLKNIKSVATPIEDYDAVNKAYVDAMISSIDCCGSTSGNTTDSFYENSVVLDNNVLLPEDIPDFNFPSSVKAFVSYVYVQYNTDDYALQTLRGINKNGSWYINTTYIGENTDVQFSIRDDNGTGIIQYINRHPSGITSIKYRTVTQIENTASGQINYALANSSTFIDIPGLSFLNQDITSNKIVIHVTSATDNRHGLYFINCVLKGDEWGYNIHSIGNIQDIQFRLSAQSLFAKIQYKNTNLSGDYYIRAKQYKILKTADVYTFNANTFIPTVTGISDLTFDIASQTNFRITLSVEVPDIDKYALFEIEGFYGENKWTINTRSIGDRIGVDFSITTSLGVGYLKYTNINSVNAYIRYAREVPTLFQPLPVNKGGTGNTYLTPYAVLRGNGIDPIVGTEDFIYKDYAVILGTSSSIIINNTSPAVNLSTGGTITTYGGVAINKNLIVGDTLSIKNIDVTPSIGDIASEKGFYAQNNQVMPANVDGFDFSNIEIKSFTGVVCITISQLNDEQLDSLYEIKGLKKKNGWYLNTSFIGDNLGIKFSITPSGQIQYTSTNQPDWISTLMKFRAITTTI